MSQEILAVIAGEEITQKEFDTFLQGVPQQQQAYLSNPQFRQQCLEQLITLYLFAKKGEEINLEESEEFKAIMANARREVLARLAMGATLEKVAVSEEDMKSFYEENKALFVKEPSVSAKHILVASEEECSKILEAVVNGEKTFEEAARESSTCPSGQRGGDLGEFGRGQMVKEFEEAAFDAEIGHVVGPVQTKFGFHLIKVEAKNEGGVADFEEVKESIYKEMIQMKQRDVYEATVAELKEKYMEK